MLYMVEMDFRNPAREADWHVWYIGHVAKLVRTVPGFRASQRFRAMTPTPSPWLAMHDVVSGAVFESKEYKANGGPASTGEWQSAHTNWYRNLFAGIDNTPEVAARRPPARAGGRCQAAGAGAPSVTWLESAGLDRTAGRRGLAIVPPGRLTAGLFDLPGVRIFKPISPRIAK